VSRFGLFDKKAPKIMYQLMQDFPELTAEDAAAIVGNAGHECDGFRTLQEVTPLVPGSLGGWGWMQWTGPRRRAFNAWVKRKGFDPSSFEANYSFLFRELAGHEEENGARALANTMKAEGIANKVRAFERTFLRAGIKHYDSRVVYANRALEAWHKSDKKHKENTTMLNTILTRGTAIKYVATFIAGGMAAVGFEIPPVLVSLVQNLFM